MTEATSRSRQPARAGSVSLSTYHKLGQRNRLVYFAGKKCRPFKQRGISGPKGAYWRFSTRRRERRNQLPDARTARFSKTVDLDWRHGGRLGHRQLTIFLADSGGNENLLGFAPLLRRQQSATNKSWMTKCTRPLFYEQMEVPFYYLLQTQWDVFHRSWSHAVRAAHVVVANRQGVIWPDIKWGRIVGDEVEEHVVELCRTPIPAVRIHYTDEFGKELATKVSVPHNPAEPTAYEVVELVCKPASEINREMYWDTGEKRSDWNKNESHYRKVPVYTIRIRREAEDEEGNPLQVSYLGYSSELNIPIKTVLKLIEDIPEFLEDTNSYLAGHKDQSDNVLHYKHHPNPRLRKWGFYATDELKGGAARLHETFATQREDAYLLDKSLFEAGDCPRYRDKKRGLTGLHPLYVARLAAMAAGELLWRSEWAVDEYRAWKDIQALQRFEKKLLAAAVFVYVFCPAVIHVFFDRATSHRYSLWGVRCRKSLDGTKLIKLRFCRGPPPSL